MGSDRQIELRLRQAELVARSGALRSSLGEQAQALEHPLALADRVRDAFRWLTANPLWLAGIAAVPVVMRPRRALGWAIKLWGAWRLWRQIQSSLRA
jgi:hypothetical protein